MRLAPCLKLVIRAVVFGILFVGAATAWGGYEEVFKNAKAAAWAIYVRTTGGMSAICSASAFKTTSSETYLLTAAHCFTGNDLKRTDFLVTQDHKSFVKARLVRSGFKLKQRAKQDSSDLDDYEGDDWAIVSAEIGLKPILPLGNSAALALGEDILVVGVPFGMDFLGVQGIVGSLDMNLSTLVWNHYFGGNIFTAGGNSGSGVISTKQRAIVGVVDAGPGSQTSLLIFMPVDKLPMDAR